MFHPSVITNCKITHKSNLLLIVQNVFGRVFESHSCAKIRVFFSIYISKNVM